MSRPPPKRASRASAPEPRGSGFGDASPGVPSGVLWPRRVVHTDCVRTAGGSSGGSAAALASGFGALSIGSDLAGSPRTPAHLCGIHAHKPTLGLAASRGMVPPTAPALPADPDLAVVGPMARTARDLTLLLDVMAGPDPLTSGVAHSVTLPPAPRAAP